MYVVSMIANSSTDRTRTKVCQSLSVDLATKTFLVHRSRAHSTYKVTNFSSNVDVDKFSHPSNLLPRWTCLAYFPQAGSVLETPSQQTGLLPRTPQQGAIQGARTHPSPQKINLPKFCANNCNFCAFLKMLRKSSTQGLRHRHMVFLTYLLFFSNEAMVPPSLSSACPSPGSSPVPSLCAVRR